MVTILDRAECQEKEQKLRRAFGRGIILGRIQDLRELQGLTLKKAQACVGKVIPHSTYQRQIARMREFGWRGLVDRRRAPAPRVTRRIEGFLEGMASGNPALPTVVLRDKVAKRFDVAISIRTVQTKLRAANLSRPRAGSREKGGGKGVSSDTCLGAADRRDGSCVKEELGGAGLAWLKVASEDTGYCQELAESIQEVAKELPAPVISMEVDRSNRDEKGRFLPEYNAPRPRSDPQVGTVFESLDFKEMDKDLRRLSIVGTRCETIADKLLALIALPVVSERGRFDGVTDPRGEWLCSLGGLDYMPETLAKFARELKYARVSAALLERHAQVWHRELSGSLGEDASALILYIDGTTKPYWTDLFSRSGKVAMIGRVMPCLETVLIHTGAGVPLYLRTFAGSASLVNNLLPTLHEMEEAIGKGMLGRLTVVDGGMNSVALFKEFDRDHRGFVTPLSRSQVKDLSQVEHLTPMVPYREGDTIGGG